MSWLSDIRVSKALDRSTPHIMGITIHHESKAFPTGNKPPPLPRSQRIEASQAQPQSRLLARLSPELRLMIWESVLGDQRIHIIQRSQQRLGHVVCPSPPHEGTKTSSPKHHTRRNSDHFCDICHGTGIPQPAKEGDLARSKNKVMLLGLALTCRQMYGQEHPNPKQYIHVPLSENILHSRLHPPLVALPPSLTRLNLTLR